MDSRSDQASGCPLLEATMVQDQEEQPRDEESGEVVVAEKLTRDNRISKRSLVLFVVSALTLCLAAVVAGVGLFARKGEGSGSAENLSSKPTGNKESSTQSTATKCFEHRSELLDAIDAYWQQNDSSTNSTVGQKYGWPIGSWCVSDVTDFTFLFRNKQLQEDIGDWNMTSAIEMEEMVRGIHNMSANLGLQRWDTSNMRSLKALFMSTRWVEPMLDLSSWNTSQVTNMNQLFRRSYVEKPGVKHWDTSRVINIGQLAEGNRVFNDDLRLWTTGSIRTMDNAFKNAESFNQDISGWDTHSLRNMRNAFLNSGFNQDISGWNVSIVVDLEKAFQGAKNFSQDLCAWGAQLPSDAITSNMFAGTACPNTTDPVIPWGPFCFNCN